MTCVTVNTKDHNEAMRILETFSLHFSGGKFVYRGHSMRPGPTSRLTPTIAAGTNAFLASRSMKSKARSGSG
jgi:hypothetical protein